MVVGTNSVLGRSVGTCTGAGRVMRVKGTCGFVRFVFKGRVCRAVGVIYEYGLFAGVIVHAVVLVGIFCAMFP